MQNTIMPDKTLAPSGVFFISCFLICYKNQTIVYHKDCIQK